MNTKCWLSLFIFFQGIQSQHYDSQTADCRSIPEQSFGENMQFMWSKTYFNRIDQWFYITVCPLVILTELVIMKFHHSYPKVMGKKGLLYCILMGFEMVRMFDLLVTTAYFVADGDGAIIPSAFSTYCQIVSIIMGFVDILFYQFVIIILLYIIYVLRSTLRSNVNFWRFLFVMVLSLTSVTTFIFYQYGYLGFNIYGVCGNSFVRTANSSIGVPLALILKNVFFLVAGVFTVFYFKKHYPDSEGFRSNRKIEQQNIIFFVTGYSIFWFIESSINFILYQNCMSGDPKVNFHPLATTYNILTVLQCTLIFFVIFRDVKYRRAFRKFLSRFCSKKGDQNEYDKSPSFTRTIGESSRDEDGANQMQIEEIFLKIKDESNNIDILKVSQIVTIVSGIYLAYKECYYHRQDIFDICIMPNEERQKTRNFTDITQRQRKTLLLQHIKKMCFYEKISVKMDAQIIKDFILDISLIPRLGVLQCQMVIHAPKVFQLMLESDNLESVFSSFQLHKNTRKMFDLVEGKGGRSGQFVFFSYDNKYVLKTITPDEFGFIERNLVFFYEHFTRNPDSLLAKIYGLFTFHGNEIQRTYHLILMKNILGCSKSQILRTYDLKGSRYDREVNVGDTFASEELHKKTLKDLDFLKEEGRIRVADERRLQLREVVEKDSLFLRNLNILDYSLLVIKVYWGNRPEDPGFWGDCQRLQSEDSPNEFYHIGVIDYLQRWDLQKRGEKWWKKLLGKKDFSAERPDLYQERFTHFFRQITLLNQNETWVQEERERQNSSIPIEGKIQKFVLQLEEQSSSQGEETPKRSIKSGKQQLQSFNTKKAEVELSSLRGSVISYKMRWPRESQVKNSSDRSKTEDNNIFSKYRGVEHRKK